MKAVKLCALYLFACMMVCACGDDPVEDVTGGSNGNNSSMPIMEAVDLGLSVKWATCNVGASSPEKYGEYYAWGEIEPKDSYCSSNGLWSDVEYSSLQSKGVIDADGNLTSAYDVATQKWGGSWRMPTLAEQKELIDDCDWIWHTINDVNGYLVTGKNGNSIFLPAAGDFFESELDEIGLYGAYWGSTAYDEWPSARCIEFYSNRHNWVNISNFVGKSVRPVCR